MTAFAYPIHEWLPLIAIGVGALLYAIRQGLELSGHAPGADLLRRENGDLVRRNTELEETVRRHESLIKDLSRKVAELEAQSQKAVLDALLLHEAKAAERFEQHMQVAEGHERLLERVAVALETQTGGT